MPSPSKNESIPMEPKNLRGLYIIKERTIVTIDAHFSPLKKKLQHLGSWTVRVASKSDIPDAPSGFRAYSRETAMKFQWNQKI